MADATPLPFPGLCIRCGALKFRNARGKIYCKPCASRIYREWRQRDPELTRQRAHEHYMRRRDAHLAKAREYYEANKEAIAESVKAWQAANPDKVRAAKRKWSSSRPEKGREYQAQRRARLLAAICEHGPQCVTATYLLEVVKAPCVYCGAPATDADHVIPLTRGGLNCRDNIAPACGRCNKSKGNRLLTEWEGYKRGA